MAATLNNSNVAKNLLQSNVRSEIFSVPVPLFMRMPANHSLFTLES